MIIHYAPLNRTTSVISLLIDCMPSFSWQFVKFWQVQFVTSSVRLECLFELDEVLNNVIKDMGAINNVVYLGPFGKFLYPVANLEAYNNC